MRVRIGERRGWRRERFGYVSYHVEDGEHDSKVCQSIR